jgi:hypothetical protein
LKAELAIGEWGDDGRELRQGDEDTADENWECAPALQLRNPRSIGLPVFLRRELHRAELLAQRLDQILGLPQRHHVAPVLPLYALQHGSLLRQLRTNRRQLACLLRLRAHRRAEEFAQPHHLAGVALAAGLLR